MFMDQASNPTTRDLNTIADTPALLVGAPRSGTTWLQPACSLIIQPVVEDTNHIC